MTTSTTDGEPTRCAVCGKVVRVAPSVPPGDATCPHCGALLWFDISQDSDTLRALWDRGAEVEMDEQGEVVLLRLFGPAYTDAAILYLAMLRDLATLDLRETQLTPEGVGRLRKQLPGVTILYE